MIFPSLKETAHQLVSKFVNSRRATAFRVAEDATGKYICIATRATPAGTEIWREKPFLTIPDAFTKRTSSMLQRRLRKERREFFLPYGMQLDAIVEVYREIPAEKMKQILEGFEFYVSGLEDNATWRNCRSVSDWLFRGEVISRLDRNYWDYFFMTLVAKGQLHSGINGLALYEIGGKFTHSCAPNANYYVNDQGEMVVTLIEDVEENDPIKLSYLDEEDLVVMPNGLRLEALKSLRLSECYGCERCGFGWEIEDQIVLDKSDIDQYFTTPALLETYLPDCAPALRGLVLHRLCQGYRAQCLKDGPTEEIVMKWFEHFKELRSWIRKHMELRNWNQTFLSRQIPGLWKCLTMVGKTEEASELRSDFLRLLRVQFGEEYDLVAKNS